MNSQSSCPQSDKTPQVERFDGLDRYYTPIEKYDRVAGRLFWGAAVLSFVALLSDRIIPWVPIRPVPEVLFAILVVTNLGMSLSLRFHLIPDAEQKRRRQLLSDAFGVPLTPEQTRKYYNNSFGPSIGRLGANVLENAHFAKRVCAGMANWERVKVAVYAAIWLAAALYRGTALELVVAITQTVFSGEILARWISIEYLRWKNNEIFDELHREFFYKVDLNSPKGIACVLDAFAAYESVKALAGIKQSSAIFAYLNEPLSREWDKVKVDLEFE